jgi:hypothetical protein
MSTRLLSGSSRNRTLKFRGWHSASLLDADERDTDFQTHLLS